MKQIKTWFQLNKDSVLTILTGIGIMIAIAMVFTLAKMLQP